MQKINVLNKKIKTKQRIYLFYYIIYVFIYYYLFSHRACPLQFEMRA